MKICWDNLEKVYFKKNKGVWYNKNGICFVYVESCKICGDPFISAKHSRKLLYCSRNCQLKDCVKRSWGEKDKKRIGDQHRGEKSSNWKGGVTRNNIPLFDTYAPQISWCEEVRRDPEDKNTLQVKCTYCGKWYRPTLKSLANRVSTLKEQTSGENRFYCSTHCKQSCSIFGAQKYPKNFINKDMTAREVQPELRKMVFERDDWSCIRCGSNKELRCHHIDGVHWNPLESADIDVCITLCTLCHEEVHKQEKCRKIDMVCKK